jgi:hypothetical protein
MDLEQNVILPTITTPEQSSLQQSNAIQAPGPNQAPAPPSSMPALRSQPLFFMIGVVPTPPEPDILCSICTEVLAEDVVQIVKCAHSFHTVCLLGWLQSSTGKHDRRCPSCRQVLYESTPSLPTRLAREARFRRAPARLPLEPTDPPHALLPRPERPRLYLITGPLRREEASPPPHAPPSLRRPARRPLAPANSRAPHATGLQVAINRAPLADIPSQHSANVAPSSSGVTAVSHQPSGEQPVPTTNHAIDNAFGVRIVPGQGGSHDDSPRSSLHVGGRQCIRTNLGARTPLSEEQRNDPQYTRLVGDQGGWTELQEPRGNAVLQVAAQAAQDLRTGPELSERDVISDEAAARADDEELEMIQRVVQREMAEYRAVCLAPIFKFAEEMLEVLNVWKNRREDEEDVFEDAVEHHEV